MAVGNRSYPLDLIDLIAPPFPKFPGRVTTFLGRLLHWWWLLFPHNPETVEVMPPQVQPEKREETMEIIPIHRPTMWGPLDS